MGYRFTTPTTLPVTLLATTAALVLLGGCAHDSGFKNGIGSGSFASAEGSGVFGGGNGLGGGGGFGLFKRKAPTVQISDDEAADSVSKSAMAYTKNPQDANTALAYARVLRAQGNQTRALSVLRSAYIANPNHGTLAAELGKAALQSGQTKLASSALQTAEKRGVKDWRTLSAQGTLAAKGGDHARAQKYYRAALKKNPGSSSVLNNLALSYALDGKAKEAEQLLRHAADQGHDDKRLRQNLALILGVQGKYNEAHEVAAVDMGDTKARKSVAYLKNMLNKPQAVASAEPASPGKRSIDWAPFATTAPSKTAKPVRTAAATAQAPKAPTKKAAMPIARVEMVKPVDEVVTSPRKYTEKMANATSWQTTVETASKR